MRRHANGTCIDQRLEKKMLMVILAGSQVNNPRFFRSEFKANNLFRKKVWGI